MYWQNSASYLIHATLSEKDTSITGDVTISYVNNSPDQLEYVWLQLDQNLFDLKSRGVAATPAINDLMGVKAIDQGGTSHFRRIRHLRWEKIFGTTRHI